MEEGWQEVYMTADQYRATMAKDILGNAGIKAVILNQHDSAHKSFGEFLVHVKNEDVAKAVELLKELKGE